MNWAVLVALAGAPAVAAHMSMAPIAQTPLMPAQIASAPAAQATTVEQIPAGALPRDHGEPLADNEAGAVAPLPKGLPPEVSRAWLAIAARGEVPGVESLMAELGPETMTRLFGQPALPPQLLQVLSSQTAR